MRALLASFVLSLLFAACGPLPEEEPAVGEAPTYQAPPDHEPLQPASEEVPFITRPQIPHIPPLPPQPTGGGLIFGGRDPRFGPSLPCPDQDPSPPAPVRNPVVDPPPDPPPSPCVRP
jgi:hypothetical protein